MYKNKGTSSDKNGRVLLLGYNKFSKRDDLLWCFARVTLLKELILNFL